VRLFRRFRVIRTDRQAPGWLEAFRWTVTGLVFVAFTIVVLVWGYRIEAFGVLRWLMNALNPVVVIVTLVDVVLGFLFAPAFGPYVRRRWLDLALLIPIVAALIGGHSALLLIALRQFIVLAQTFLRSRRFAGVIGEIRRRPIQLLAVSFVLMIALGAVLLTRPGATADGRGAPVVDALFTSTSAVCVTGLIVRDTQFYWSRFGQWVILVLIQLGGLGIMTFSASIIALIGGRLGVYGRQAMSEVVEDSRDLDIAHSLRYILLFTLLAEALGFVVLFLRWVGAAVRPLEAAYNALFHSVSAFCNAGFSVFSTNLAAYPSDVIVNLTVIALILLGGLGFSVVHEVFNRRNLRILNDRLLRRSKAEPLPRLSAHAFLVLSTSGLLLLAGAVLFFFFEYDNALSGFPIGTKLLASLFQSVTPRTAGFNTVPFGALRPVTLFIITILMFIGASPGGTGGGIKTSTIAVLFLTLRNLVVGGPEVEVRGRSLTRDTIRRATGIAIGAATVISLVFVVLLVTEQLPFLSLLFEAMSAFGTVGLSTGVTPLLSVPGKLSIILLMYVGRLGPLTLALTMRVRQSRPAVHYPQARVIVG
jgi:trk system potassium uptake protein TrkH